MLGGLLKSTSQLWMINENQMTNRIDNKWGW